MDEQCVFVGMCVQVDVIDCEECGIEFVVE